jgi:hypothetical protein
MKRVVIGLLMVQLIGVAIARAQTADDVEIAVNVFEVKTNGAEQPAGGAFSSGPVSRKSSGGGRFSLRSCGAFTIEAGAEGPFAEGATSGWRVELTPIGMKDGAVTFRLRWIRALDTGKEMSPKSEDIELTMRPGESRTLDSVSVPPDKATGRPCPIWDSRGKQIELSRVALRVSVEYTPHESLERRLVGVDLWLIERMPGRSERSQALSIRGLPHREIPFYFDAIAENAISLEVLGHVTASPEGETIAVALQTRSHWGPSAFDWRDGKRTPTRYVDSRLRMKPGETVEVALPRLEGSAGPFADRTYAIRIRVRQLR